LPYEARLEVLRLWTLEERRNRADLIEVYKMVHGLSSVPMSAFFQYVTNSCTRGHSWKLMKAHCRTDIRLYFFSSRVLNRWNSLSQEMVVACSVNAFKRQLEKIRISRMGFFMDSWSAWPYWLLFGHKWHGVLLFWWLLRNSRTWWDTWWDNGAMHVSV